MCHMLAQQFSWWARMSQRAQMVTLGIVVVVVLVVGVGGSFALHRLRPPSMAELARDTCASVKQTAESRSVAEWHLVLSTDADIIAATMRTTRGRK